MSKRFEGQVALVTGGASRIGLEIVRSLLEEGVKVVIGDYDSVGISAVKVKLEKMQLRQVYFKLRWRCVLDIYPNQ
jgi:NAD(P)-dependent dehydrogenase (short-subunit alcohol dehydrogenase family)